MKNLIILVLVSVLVYTAVGISSPLISLYLQALGADYAQISWILSSVVITSLLSSYAWGRLSDRIGQRKPILIGGLLILSIAYFLLSRAPDGQWAWAARIFEGIGSAAYATLGLAMIGDLMEQGTRRGLNMGIVRGLGSLAFALGSTLGGRLADATSIAQTLMVCAALYGSAAICALILTEVRRAPIIAEPVTLQLTHGATKAARALPVAFLAGVFLWISAHSASASMWPNYMTELGYSKTAIGSLWGLAATIELPAMLGAGFLSDIIGRTPLLIAGGLGISLTNLGYLFLAQIFPLLLGVQVMRALGYGSYTTTAMTFAAENADQQTRGRKSGIFNTTMSAGQLLGTYLGGTIVQAFGFHFLYGVCAALAFMSAVCFFILRKPVKSAEPLAVTH